MSMTLNSLRVRIALLVLLIFMPVFALIVVSSRTQQELALERGKADALALAQGLRADNQQYIESTVQQLQTLSRLDAVRNADWAACNDILTDLFAGATMYVNVFVVDAASGLNVCSVNERSLTLDNRTFEWYQETLRTGAVTVSEYRLGPVSGQPLVTIAVPVFGATGEIQAVVAAGLSLTWLNNSLSGANLPAQSTVTLVDRGGTMLARFPLTEGEIGQPYRNQTVLRTALNSEGGTLSTEDHTGVKRIYAYTTLQPSAGNITVIVGVPERILLADAEDVRDRSLLALGGITLFVVALGWLTSGMLVRPIRNLTRTTRDLASGRLESRTDLSTEIVELQEMLNAFNDMAAAVERTILERVDELAAANAKLELEIEERTQAQARTRLLQELTAALSEAVTSDAVASVIVEKGLMALGGNVAAIAVRAERRPVLKLVRQHGMRQEATPEFEEMSFDSDLPLVEAFRTGEPVWIESESQYAARYPDLHAASPLGPLPPHSMACLPLTIAGKTIGSIGVSFAAPRVMDDNFRALMQAVADYCSQALERARLYEEELVARQAAEAATTRIARLHAVTAALADALTAEEVGRIIAEQGTLVLGAAHGSFLMLADGDKSLRMLSSMGGKLSGEELAQWQQFPLDPALPVADAILRKTMLTFHSAEELTASYPAMAPYATLYPGGMVLLPIVVRGKAVGAIVFAYAEPQALDDEDQLFMVALMHQAAIALERARLAQQTRETAVLQERQRLARDLHDAVSQTLFSSTLIAEALVRQWQRSPQKAIQRLNQLIVLNRGAMAEMRALLFELRPEALEKTDLKDLLSQLVDAAQGRKRVKARLNLEGAPTPLPTEVHVALYRIAQESINNIVKHSKATEFEIRLSYSENEIALSVTDNGQGFDSNRSSSGIGLGSMHERADAIGATLEIGSTPGEGTTVTVHWSPTPSPAAPERAEIPSV